MDIELTTLLAGAWEYQSHSDDRAVTLTTEHIGAEEPSTAARGRAAPGRGPTSRGRTADSLGPCTLDTARVSMVAIALYSQP